MFLFVWLFVSWLAFARCRDAAETSGKIPFEFFRFLEAEFWRSGLKIAASRSSGFVESTLPPPPPPPPPIGANAPFGGVPVALLSSSEPRLDPNPLPRGGSGGGFAAAAAVDDDDDAVAATAAAVVAGLDLAGGLTTGSMHPEGPIIGVSSSDSETNSSDSLKNSSSL